MDYPKKQSNINHQDYFNNFHFKQRINYSFFYFIIEFKFNNFLMISLYHLYQNICIILNFFNRTYSKYKTILLNFSKYFEFKKTFI